MEFVFLYFVKEKNFWLLWYPPYMNNSTEMKNKNIEKGEFET